MDKESIRFLQFNLNKCFAAQSNLMVELTTLKNEHFIVLVQEPHFHKKKPSSLNNSFIKAFHSNDDWPRAMILCSKNLNISIIESLSCRDTTCVTLHSSKEEVIVASCYHDIEFPEVVNNLESVLDYAKNKGKDTLIGSDTNAHAQIWMSEKDNPRGEIFTDFIAMTIYS